MSDPETNSIPEGWRLTRLPETVNAREDFIDGDWIEAPFITDSGIRLIQTGNIGIGDYLDKPANAKYISRATFKLLHCTKVTAGDILICRLAEPVGRACMVPKEIGESITSVDCVIYRPDRRIADARFMVHLLNAPTSLAAAADLSGGSTRQRVSRTALGSLSYVLPPLDEQSRIADVLDTVDDQIGRLEQSSAKRWALARGLASDLLARASADNTSRRLRLADAVSLPSGQVDPKRAPYADMTLVAPDHIESHTGLLLARKTAREQGAISGKYLFDAGDVVYSKIRPYLRKAILADSLGICSADMYPVRPSPDLNPRYLLAILLGEDFSRFAESVSMRTGIPKLNREEFREYFVSLPSLAVQEAVAATLTASDESMAVEVMTLRKMRLLRDGLKSDLLSGRVRLPTEVAS